MLRLQKSSSGRNKVCIYPSGWKIEYCEVADYISELTGIIAEVRASFFDAFKIDTEKLAVDFAAARIFDIFSTSCSAVHESYAIAGIEKEFIEEKKPVYGVLYDATRVATALRKWIPKREMTLDINHIVFIDRLIASHTGERYHARMLYCSLPSIISTLGMIQAPARPREFYILRNSNPSMPEEAMLEQFKERVLTYDDPRLTEVTKGLALQIVLWANGYEPFCENPTCRLYNAHWQEELIKSQMQGKICRKHQRIIKKIKDNQNETTKKR